MNFSFSSLYSNLISSCVDPVSWNFSEFQTGDMVENNIDVQLEHVELAPQGVALDITSFPQVSLWTCGHGSKFMNWKNKRLKYRLTPLCRAFVS